ncbi:Protein CBG27869 [Caenorhabditis briggsae]|uniref:Protein CBG27869 n=1 Tax=Caenorhabditis briggsae TaxID=6238 RepID=B6IEG4_CAEBR|nr:Protein CBG27869 [Caenorhabditis briggsae]CAR98294.1 Protein CBG27869 [Caenorhabditis briggsae]
MNEEWKEEDKK